MIGNRFKNNMSGEDWVNSFIKRKKASRALVNSNVIKYFKYFDNLTEEFKDVPPQNLFNYDETNITDDPGSKTVIVRRGHGRRIEQ